MGFFHSITVYTRFTTLKKKYQFFLKSFPYQHVLGRSIWNYAATKIRRLKGRKRGRGRVKFLKIALIKSQKSLKSELTTYSKVPYISPRGYMIGSCCFSSVADLNEGCRRLRRGLSQRQMTSIAAFYLCLTLRQGLSHFATRSVALCDEVCRTLRRGLLHCYEVCRRLQRLSQRQITVFSH